MGETTLNPEPKTPISFEQVRTAFTVFKSDYNIVAHPETPINTPFNRPNGPDATGHRQYNLTTIPADMTEADFLAQIEDPAGVVVAIGCMDKDAALPAYEVLKTENPDKKIVYITVAGGIVQKEQERIDAMRTILTYVSQHQEHVEAVIATDHDHTCGKIKVDLGGTALAEKIGAEVPNPGQNASQEEQEKMKSLIAGGVTEVGLPTLFPGKLKQGLVQIDREGSASIDYGFEGVQPQTINQLIDG
ncbi:MAG: hypothetical protein WC489_05170 [Patescibacteria group bacterium]